MEYSLCNPAVLINQPIPISILSLSLQRLFCCSWQVLMTSNVIQNTGQEVKCWNLTGHNYICRRFCNTDGLLTDFILQLLLYSRCVTGKQLSLPLWREKPSVICFITVFWPTLTAWTFTLQLHFASVWTWAWKLTGLCLSETPILFNCDFLCRQSLLSSIKSGSLTHWFTARDIYRILFKTGVLLRAL